MEQPEKIGWGIISIRHSKYRKLDVRRLIVIIFSSEGNVMNYHEAVRHPMKKRKREIKAR
jgi:hypothetical protein